MIFYLQERCKTASAHHGDCMLRKACPCYTVIGCHLSTYWSAGTLLLLIRVKALNLGTFPGKNDFLDSHII